MKVLVSDKLSPKGVEIFEKAKGIEVEVKTKLPPEELKAIIGEYDGLVIRSATKVKPEIIEAADKLKVIGRAGSGLDNVDIPAASKKGIVVMNTPGGNTITTAEHAISMMLALSRKIPQATASMKSKKWEKSKFMGSEIYNKTLGIMGIGSIGSVVADRARGLKMNVLAYDPFLSPERAEKLGVELVNLDDLLKRSDYITIHVPKSKETINLVNKELFSKMKDGVFLINCARGGIVNEKDLCDAIKSGKVAGAALDVFEKEPPDSDNPLLDLDEVICTPHLGASTEEAQEKVAVAIAEQMVDYLLNGTIMNAANVPSVDSEILSTIRPYLDLAERLGSFQGQVISGGLEQISIEYSGEAAALETAPITVSLLKGLLYSILKEDVNYVNAPVIAKERGIKVIESTTNESEDFTSLITLKVKTSKEERLVAGTIFGKSDPWIVQVDQFRIEAIPEKYMFLFHTHDRPGVIGNIGTSLAKHSINISRMQFGREKVEGKSLLLLSTDGSVPSEITEQLKGLPHVISLDSIEI
ncbi:MAG: phosphoglycerate dehydrogenase [Deltaproteobacteria bacterium]|nr:phosphoglycerate dehydrogenase [Deltaproteobacteria bacterium]